MANYVFSCGASIEQVNLFSSKLLYVRHKTPIHIVKCISDNSRDAWTHAGITGDEFTRTLYSVGNILAILKQQFLGGELEAVTPYDGSDIQKIVAAYDKVYGKGHGVSSNR